MEMKRPPITPKADGTPVHPRRTRLRWQENMTEVMGDTMLNQQGEDTNLAAETQGRTSYPLRPQWVLQDRMALLPDPSNQFMDNTPDPLESIHGSAFRRLSEMFPL